MTARWQFYDSYEAFPFNRGLRDRVVDELMLGMYDDADGSCVGEWTLAWRDIGKRDGPAIRLEAFDDAWATLAESGLLLVLAALCPVGTPNPSPSKRDVIAALVEAGWEDRTEETRFRP